MMSVKEIKQVQDDKQRLTEHFIKVLPPLIDKYRADADKLINLLSIPQYFDLDIYTTSRQESVSKPVYTFIIFLMCILLNYLLIPYCSEFGFIT